jgi:hypothetical protein
MEQNMLYYKQNITNLPTYNDGKFRLFEIKQTKDTFPVEYLHDTGKVIWFEELSISDRLRFEAEERKKNITYKIRIPQIKSIDSLCVVKIGNVYHKIYNAYHFTNKEGFKQTDLTLVEYPRVKLEGEL